MGALFTHLERVGGFADVALPPVIDALLRALVFEKIESDGRGTAKGKIAAKPLFLDLSLNPPGPSIPFLLRTGEPEVGFRLWLELAATPPAKRLFELLGASPSLVLQPAIASVSAAGVTLVSKPGTTTITGITVALLIEGRRPLATMRLVPTIGAPDGVVQLMLGCTNADETVEPSAALIGQTGFGIEAPDGIVIDMSSAFAHLGPTGGEASAANSDPAWQGLSIPNLAFYLPAGVPVFGDCRVTGRLEIGLSPATGMALTIATTVPPRNGWPALDVRIECIDPAAAGLSGLAPTLVEVAVELPFDQRSEPVSEHGAFTFAGGKPLVARARFIRDPTAQDGATLLTVAIEGQGIGGLLSVDASQGMAAKLVVAGGAFATAIVADKGPSSSADGSGVAIHALLLAAVGASAFLQNKGKLVLHGAALISEGRGLPLGGKLRFRLDYSVDVMIIPIGIGSLSVQMKPEQPMRVRLREVVLAFDPTQFGLDMFSLDFGQADMEVEDPGGWLVNGPDSLFDILGTRSGRGSLWFEVDLAFRLDLGPVKVSGATLRATLVDGKPVVSLRGLDASLVVPALIEGKGGFKIDDAGFSASLGASLIPLGASGLATLDVKSGDGTTMVLVNLDLDLPGPLPLGPSGLALFGVGGTLGIFARPTSAKADENPVTFLLSWKPDRSGFEASAGTVSLGIRVAVGTAPDMGFMLGALASVVITAPDFALRGSASATLLGSRPRLVSIDEPIPAPGPISITGAFLIDPAREVTFGLNGNYSAAPLFKATIPIGGHFPVEHPERWYINIGSDGCLTYKDRKGGPAKMTILPSTLFEKSVHAYLMIRGHELADFPFNPLRIGSGHTYTGYVVAFGFSFDWHVGVKPFLWAEVHGGFNALVASTPLVVAGNAWIGGSIHIGPASVGLDATIEFILAPGRPPFVYARLCGVVDLWLTSVRECFSVRLGGDSVPTFELPKPNVHPLDRMEGENVVGHGAILVDDQYRSIAPLGTSADVQPAVWADAIVLLQFAVTPRAGSVNAPQFSGLTRCDQAPPIGSERLFYWWTLESMSLVKMFDDGSEANVAGALLAGWQEGRFGDTSKIHEAAELALLTREKTLFTKRMPDGGRNLPHDPVGNQARVCEAAAKALPGWALGRPAERIANVWHLPPDEVSPAPARSRVEADIGMPKVKIRRGTLEFDVPIDSIEDDDISVGADRLPACTEAFKTASHTKPPFTGAFWLDGWRQIFGAGFVESAQISWSTQMSCLVRMNGVIHDGQVWLVTELGADWAKRNLTLNVLYQGQSTLLSIPHEVPLFRQGEPDSRFAVLFKVPTRFDQLQINYPLGCRLGILGIGGVTQAALDWAAVRNQELAAEAAALAASAAAGPQLDPITAEGLRTILEPGALYRLDVGLSWGASMVQPDDTATTLNNQDKYAPRGGGDDSTNRSYYFRTFALSTPVPADPMAVFDGRWRFSPPKDPFKPELLERHLIGYTPAQSEQNWFRIDPLEAHFGVQHVAALAHVYGYELAVGVQRVDVPGEPGGLQILTPALGSLSRPLLLYNGGDQYAFEAASASPCDVPLPGMSASVSKELAPRAWYEVHVALPSKSSGIPDSRLPGVTFRTSRYRHVGELAQAIGFGFSEPERRDGDVALAIDPATLSISSVFDDDLAFDEMMALLGMEGWPLSTEPRTSVLWRRAAAGWLLGGVLVECPEPIHRPGRCEVGGLRLLSGGVSSATFDVVRRDRSGSRFLFMTRTPVTPQRWRAKILPIPKGGKSGGRVDGSIGANKGQAEPSVLGKKFAVDKLRIFQDPRLEMAFTDFAHNPPARTGKLLLPTTPTFGEESA